MAEKSLYPNSQTRANDAAARAAAGKGAPHKKAAAENGAAGKDGAAVYDPLIAYKDAEFLGRPFMRAQRLALEYMKPDMVLREQGINSTIVIFGGARIPAPGEAPKAAQNPQQEKNLRALSPYYDEARRFAQISSAWALAHGGKDFIIATGGGPGMMEAGNRGAHDVGAPSIGLNIALPYEQKPNAYITPELSFRFQYFALRKMHFLLRARALLAFPGGFGTMDELFEALTLIQTGRMRHVPVILFGEAFWRQAFNAEFLAEQGMIAPKNIHMFHYADTAEAAWAIIAGHYSLTDKN